MGLRDLFTHEAGQRRRQWLNEQDARISGSLRHLFGPQLYPLAEHLAQGANMLMGGADHRDAVQASGDLMNARSGMDALQAGSTLAGSLAGVMVPGMSARAVREGADMARGAARETPAQEVARLLREGRAAEVTDDMMARVDPQEMHRLYTSGATGRPMPMDEASRMSRAREMEITIPGYHGGPQDFTAVDPERLGGVDAMGRGLYTAVSPGRASQYADDGMMMPLMTTKRRLIADYNPPNEAFTSALRRSGLSEDTISALPNENWQFTELKRNLGSERATDIARQAGYEGVDGADMFSTFDPTRVRSRFARFDPRLSHLRNLSAGVGGLGLTGLFMGDQAE